MIGCELIYALVPFSSEDDWMKRHLNVHPRTVVRELRFFRCGYGANFEIFNYEPATPAAPQPLNSDIGGHHLAFYVDDIDEATDYSRNQAGVTILGKPTESTGPSLGQRWVYFLSPWGMQLELVSYPAGKAYESALGKRLWDPRGPAERVVCWHLCAGPFLISLGRACPP